jgi:hypothetical protein
VQEIAVALFLDIEVASDKTSFEARTQATDRHSVEHTICRLIYSVLKSRNVINTLSGETKRGLQLEAVCKGDALSPILCNKN